MAAKRLGAADLLAATDTELYQADSGKTATAIVSFCNRNSTPVTVRLANLSGGIGTLQDADYLWYDIEICGNGAREKTGVAVGDEGSIVVRSSDANVSVQVYGWEEDV